MRYWLMKTERSVYSFDDLLKEKETSWTGVRNFSARIHLREMKKGDKIFIYHSGDEKAIVGTATIIKEAYPDKTAKEGDWSAVTIVAEKSLKKPLTLSEIKKNPKLKQMVLVNNSRLSVQPVTEGEWKEINSL
jgi:predicted RNA-binding protein with PUA-like domain